MMDVERVFWIQLDPLYHLKQATCIRYCKDVTEHFRTEVPGLTEELTEGFSGMKDSAMRFIRFHAVETLFTVLLGSGIHGPVPRFAAKFRNDDFNQCVAAVAEGQIPPKLEIAGIGRFDEWLTRKFKARWTSDKLSEEVIDFLRFQAAFFNLKSAYNAFKHGCRVGQDSPDFRIKSKDGEWRSVLEMTSPVGWMEWREKGSEATVSYGAVDCDAEDDHSAIVIMAMLVRAMKAHRLTTREKPLQAQMPSDLTYNRKLPSTMTLKIRFELPAAMRAAAAR